MPIQRSRSWIGIDGVVLLLGVVGVEEAAHRRVAGPVDVEQFAVAAQAAPAPDPDVGIGAQRARRQLEHHRADIGRGVGIHTRPR